MAARIAIPTSGAWPQADAEKLITTLEYSCTQIKQSDWSVRGPLDHTCSCSKYCDLVDQEEVSISQKLVKFS